MKYHRTFYELWANIFFSSSVCSKKKNEINRKIALTIRIITLHSCIEFRENPKYHWIFNETPDSFSRSFINETKTKSWSLGCNFLFFDSNEKNIYLWKSKHNCFVDFLFFFLWSVRNIIIEWTWNFYTLCLLFRYEWNNNKFC